MGKSGQSDESSRAGDPVLEFDPDWANHRAERRRFIWMLLAWWPLGAVISVLSAAAPSLAWPLLVVFAVYCYALVVPLGRIIGLPCPRCGKQFFVAARKGHWFWIGSRELQRFGLFTRQCVHCGLAKYARRDPDRQHSAEGR